MDEERLASLKELEERLGYWFKEIEWLDRALTHKSFTHEIHPPLKEANEVLEFLGDAVLNLVVSHFLFQKFPDAQEGTLSMMRSHLVKRNSLAFLSRELQLDGYLLLGKSERSNGGTMKASILANTYEALLGAIYMDSGFDRVVEIVRHHLQSFPPYETTSSFFSDYKSHLQVHTHRTFGLSPQYRVSSESGPDHNKQFQVSVTIGGVMKGIGVGKSKKEAEQNAARNALESLNDDDPIKNSE
jgi:ribonuclease-3